jgi:hypothetical protein
VAAAAAAAAAAAVPSQHTNKERQTANETAETISSLSPVHGRHIKSAAAVMVL